MIRYDSDAEGLAGFDRLAPTPSARVLRDGAQPDEPAPVLPEERGVAQIEVVDDRRLHPRDVSRVGVVRRLGRLVRTCRTRRGRVR